MMFDNELKGGENMDEEKQKEEKAKPKEPAENKDNGNPPKKINPIDETNLAAERMEAATAAAKEERLAGEESYSKMKLSGETEAGQSAEVETEDDKKKTGAKEFFKGTQLEKDIDQL